MLSFSSFFCQMASSGRDQRQIKIPVIVSLPRLAVSYHPSVSPPGTKGRDAGNDNLSILLTANPLTPHIPLTSDSTPVVDPMEYQEGRNTTAVLRFVGTRANVRPSDSLCQTEHSSLFASPRASRHQNGGSYLNFDVLPAVGLTLVERSYTLEYTVKSPHWRAHSREHIQTIRVRCCCTTRG